MAIKTNKDARYIIKINTCATDDVLQNYIHKVPVLQALHSFYVRHVTADAT